jgi:hypothetical protein
MKKQPEGALFDKDKATKHLDTAMTEFQSFVVMSNALFYKQDIDAINSVASHFHNLKTRLAKT